MAYYALSMLVIAVELAEREHGLRGHGGQVPRAVPPDRRRAEGQGLCDAEDGVLLRPARHCRRARPPPIKVADHRRPDPAAARGRPAGGRRAAPARLGKRFARVSSRLGRRTAAAWSVRVREVGGQRRLLVSVITPGRARADPAGVLRRGRVPVAARAALALQAPREPAVLRPAACRARRSTTSRPSRPPRCSGATPTGGPGVVPGQLPRHPAVACSTTSSSARTSRSSTRPGRGRSARFGEIAAGPVRADGLDLAPGGGRPPPGLRRRGRLQRTPRGRTTCSSSSTSTATTAPGSARCTRPGGPRSSST